MPRTLAPFLMTLLSLVLASIFVVMTTAFIAIPHTTGGTPGETRIAAGQNMAYHPT